MTVKIESTPSQLRPHNTVAQTAAYFQVPENKVLGWIASGAMVAVNTSQSCNQRPRWRVSRDEILSFEERRRSVPKQVATRFVRRSRMAGVSDILK